MKTQDNLTKQPTMDDLSRENVAYNKRVSSCLFFALIAFAACYFAAYYMALYALTLV